MKYAIIFPIFFFCFISIYTPYSFRTLFDLGGKTWTFHLLMLSCIMMVVVALTRLVFYFLYKYIEFKWWHYVTWCLGEVIVTSLFFALYTSLFHLRGVRMPYFQALSLSLEITFLTMIFPYLIAILLRVIENKNIDIEEASKQPEETLLKLYDEHKRLKLTIDPSAIFYVSASANYIDIHYEENDRVKVYQLRNSMKSFEAAAESHGFVRCHRSYFVNPRHIKVLSKNKEGVIYTEFTKEGVERVPVSKLYYDNLANLL